MNVECNKLASPFMTSSAIWKSNEGLIRRFAAKGGGISSL